MFYIKTRKIRRRKMAVKALIVTFAFGHATCYPVVQVTPSGSEKKQTNKKSTFLNISCIVLAGRIKYPVDISLHPAGTGLCCHWAAVPCHGPARGRVRGPRPKRGRMQGWGRAAPPPLPTGRAAMARSDCLARGDFSLAQEQTVMLALGPPNQSWATTALSFQRDMLANLEKSPVDEKCIEEPVPGRRNQRSWLWLELQVALGVGLHWSEYQWLTPFVFSSGISRAGAFAVHTKGKYKSQGRSERSENCRRAVFVEPVSACLCLGSQIPYPAFLTVCSFRPGLEQDFSVSYRLLRRE